MTQNAATDKGGQTFTERRQAAALAGLERIQRRNQAVREIMHKNSTHRTVLEIITVVDGDGRETGAFVVHAESQTFGQMWTVVNNGQVSGYGWHNRAGALLHLIGIRFGDDHEPERAARYALRVLGVADEPE